MTVRCAQTRRRSDKAVFGRARMHDGDVVGLTAKDARDRAGQLLQMCSDGVDPRVVREQKKREAEAAALNAEESARKAYDVVFEDLMENGLDCNETTRTEYRRAHRKEVSPVIGHLPIDKIGKLKVRDDIIKPKVKAGKPVQANRIKSLIHRVFEHAIDGEFVPQDFVNPIATLKSVKETPRDRYLKAPEIAKFYAGLEDAPTHPRVRDIFRVLLAVMQRRTEVVEMRRSELDYVAGAWDIPAERTKSGRPTRVPLSPMVLGWIGKPDGHDYVFHQDDGKPFDPHSVTLAMKRARKCFGLDAVVTIHDLRRTGATWLGELGVEDPIIEKLLNHGKKTVTGKVYNRAEKWHEKRDAMLAWSDKLNEIITGTPYLPDWSPELKVTWFEAWKEKHQHDELERKREGVVPIRRP